MRFREPLPAWSAATQSDEVAALDSDRLAPGAADLKFDYDDEQDYDYDDQSVPSRPKLAKSAFHNPPASTE